MGPVETPDWMLIGPGHYTGMTWWKSGTGNDGSKRDDDAKSGRGDKHVDNQQRWPRPRSQRVRETGMMKEEICMIMVTFFVKRTLRRIGD
jgi:hypothetical protein